MDNSLNKLNIIKGRMAGQSFKLKDNITYIGRGVENDIQIKDKTISRRHAKIISKDDDFYIEDLWSHNGTWIDGNRIKTNEVIKLRAGVSFTIGNTLLRIETPFSKNISNRKKHIKSDTWQVIDDKKHIRDIINNLIANEEPINVRIKGDDMVFASKFIKIDNECLFSTLREHPNLIIEKLIPERGNRIIQSVTEADVDFLFKNHIWQCSLEYQGISSLYTHIGHIVRLPEYIEVKENRSNPRSIYEIMGFVAAEFTLNKGPNKDKTYNLDVLNCSKNGLGLLITKKDFELTKLLKKNYRIPDITFFSEEAMIKVDGTVKHITKIKDGENKGSYLLGLESSAIINSCKST
jgi:pSer/pThr/pTyr-binding forkhead associated (FHA) protein